MNDFKFIHCGDFHLDARFTYTGLTGEKAILRRKELLRTFNKVIDKMLNEEIEILLIAGDLFEHEYVNRETVKYIINEFERLKNSYIFITPGNHDPYVKNSYYKLYEWPDNVYIFNSNLKKVFIDKYNVVIYGLGFEGKYIYNSKINEIKDLVEEEKKDTFKILLTHGTLNGVQGNCEYHPIPIDEIKKLTFDYTALGHYHQKSIGESIAYCGSPEPLGFDELGEHGIIVGEFSKNELTLSFESISIREFAVEDIDVTGFDNTIDVEKEIAKTLDFNKNSLIKIILKGEKEQSLNINLEVIKEMFQEKCFYFDIENNTTLEYKIEEIRKEQNLRGVFVNKILKEIEKTQDIKKIEKLKEVLYLGLDALEL